jgi:hypothetical protein
MIVSMGALRQLMRAALILLVTGGLLTAAAPAAGPRVPPTLRYELTDAVLARVRPMALLPPARRSPNGEFWQPPAELLPVLLLDRPDSAWAAQQLGRTLTQLAGPNHWPLRSSFTAADLAYMRQQLSDLSGWRLDGHRLRQPKVVVVPADTVAALYRRDSARLQRQGRLELHDYTITDSLQRRYGSRRLFSIGGPVFAVGHKRAIVTVAVDEGWQTFVYRQTSAGWREEEQLEAGIGCR